MIQIQQQIESLRTLQEQLDSALHETAQESTLNSAKEEILTAVENSVQQYDSMIATQLDSIIG